MGGSIGTVWHLCLKVTGAEALLLYIVSGTLSANATGYAGRYSSTGSRGGQAVHPLTAPRPSTASWEQGKGSYGHLSG